MTPIEAKLYNKIKAFKLDNPSITMPFSIKLAREYGWNQIYTLRVIQEYKKFMFLAMIADHMVSPSVIVDRVWHHHLLYTHSYWDDFCGKVLPKSLHLSPGSGDRENMVKNYHLYAQTLQAYQKYFGDPPDDIWDALAISSGNPSHQWIDRDQNWIIPNPIYWLKSLWSSACWPILSK
jgi:hypothetical protein